MCLERSVQPRHALQGTTHRVTRGQQVDDVVIKVCDVVGNVHLHSGIAGTGTALLHKEPQHRAHHTHNKAEGRKRVPSDPAVRAAAASESQQSKKPGLGVV